MSGKLFQPPAKIIQLLLIGEGHGTAPNTDGAWPIFVNADPPIHSNFVVVSDTSPIGLGRTHVDTLYRMQYGIQVKAVSSSVESAFTKIQDIQEEFEQVLRKEVVADSAHQYEIQSINTESGPINLGRYDTEHVLYGYSLNVSFAMRVTVFPP